MCYFSRRAKPLTNGTASDTDSSGSSKKSAALSKAIQKGKLGNEVKYLLFCMQVVQHWCLCYKFVAL